MVRLPGCTNALGTLQHSLSLSAFVPAAAAVPFVLAIGLAFGKAVGAPEGFGMLTGANTALACIGMVQQQPARPG